METGPAAVVCAAATPELLLRGSSGEVPTWWEGKAGIAQLGHEGSALSKLLRLKGSRPRGAPLRAPLPCPAGPERGFKAPGPCSKVLGVCRDGHH